MKPARFVWMAAACMIVAAVVWPSAAGASAASPAVSLRNVKEIGRDLLTGPPGSESDTAVEPAIAEDPNDSGHVAAVYQEGRFQDGGAAAIGYATSRDAGRSWKFGQLPGLTVSTGGPFDRATDPSVAYGPDRSIYAGRHGPVERRDMPQRDRGEPVRRRGHHVERSGVRRHARLPDDG